MVGGEPEAEPELLTLTVALGDLNLSVSRGRARPTELPASSSSRSSIPPAGPAASRQDPLLGRTLPAEVRELSRALGQAGGLSAEGRVRRAYEAGLAASSALDAGSSYTGPHHRFAFPSKHFVAVTALREVSVFGSRTDLVRHLARHPEILVTSDFPTKTELRCFLLGLGLRDVFDC